MARKMLNPVIMATVIVIVYMTMPILSIFISSYLTTYAYMILAVCLLGFILLSGGLDRINSMAYMIFPFAVYVVLTLFINTESILIWGYKSMIFLMPVILGYYYINYRPENMGIFAKFLIFAIVITAVTTIIGVIRYPEASRILATIAESDDVEAIEYWWNNIGGYDFVYTCVLLYPIVILAYKVKRINRLTFIMAFILLMALVIFSEYTTALLLVVITSILYLADRRLNANNLLFWGLTIFAAGFLFDNIFSQFLKWLAGILSSDTLTERLTALAGGITGLENSESNRIELYKMSLSGFWSSPIFGRLLGQYVISGGHSFVLDSLANYGIIGCAAIVFMYRNVYRLFFKPFKGYEGYGYILWAFVQAIILSLVNTGMWLNVLTFFIPVTLSLIFNRDSEDYYENSLDS